MTPIEELNDRMTMETLEAEKHSRDREVQRIRAEMLQIHKLLEPKWALLGTCSKPELNQTIGGK